ncbi:MmgE/PrpD family protein [Paraburkholderia sp. BCC1886]|uniref:MmgE/PrpD family protein n=1 Tax=Paraburkholderia sp. BCC1886 TaxID=2562670 RepID=UPI001642D837|nr:MmgE/PrpD family protein [Paraburkholderia sp. BCC1886]
MTTTYVERLGAFVARLQSETLSSEVIERIRSCLLFNITVALAAPVDSDDRRAIEATHASPGEATCWRSGKKYTAADAAFRNAALICARGQNDTHAVLNGHIGCATIPAVLAVAQEENARASDISAALAAAYEVAPLIARDAAMASGARGFRGTSVYAVFAAAAGAARVLRLNEQQTASALAIAANFAGGLMQCWAEGTTEWLVQIGHASRAGVISARLAEAGMRGASLALEGPNGFYRAFAGNVPQWTWDGVTPNAILGVTFKPFPGCTINQLPVKTLLDFAAREQFGAADVEAMTLALNPAYARYPGVDRHGPFDTSTSAIMSAPFMLQIALENSVIRMADFEPGYVEPELHVRSRRIRVIEDPALPPFYCHIEVVLRDGRVLHAASASPDSLTYTWHETLRLTQALTSEWPHSDSREAHDALCKSIERLCASKAAVTARAFFEQPAFQPRSASAPE